MVQYANGNKIYSVEDATLTRTSGAFSPDDGRAYRANSPRIARGIIKYNTWEPRIAYSHTGLVEMTYAGFVARRAVFEGAYPEFTRVLLGQSFLGENMYGYRLGPVSRKHFVISCVVHGNEHDGLEGAFTGVQLLARAPDFGRLRDEWTIFFIPVMNPDGYNLDTRNLANVGTNGQTVNLNRNWDWWWGDYVEEANESKGTTPESEIEALNLLNYWRFGNGGAPVTFGFCFDLHANKDPGARYQSRERNWAPITGSAAWPEVPGSKMEESVHMEAWKLARGIQTLRARATPGYPNYYVRALHSRFNPHLHSYFSSQGVPSMIIEEVKVSYAQPGTEDYSTASDFRMDYILALAACLTKDNWVAEDGILVEPAATNILTNPSMRMWSSSEYRPQYWSLSRATNLRQPNIESQVETAGRFYQMGESIQVTAKIAVELDAVGEYTRSAITDWNYYGATQILRGAILNPTDNTVYHLDLSDESKTVLTLAVHTQTVGAGTCFGGLSNMDILGGGTLAPSTGAVTDVTRATVYPAGGEASVGNLNTGRMFHATADNSISHPVAGSAYAWVFGGYNAAGNRLTSIESWRPSTNTAALKVAVLPTALADAVAAYYTTTDKVYVFGGSTAVATAVNTIYAYDVATDACVLHGTSMLVALKHAAAAFCPANGKIYIFGGEKADGTMSNRVYSFIPATGVYALEDELFMDVDDEDNENGDTFPWNVAIGRHSAITLSTGSSDYGTIYIPGGRPTNGAGILVADIYAFTPQDGVIGLASGTDFGYIRYGSALNDTKMATFYLDNFASGLVGWTNPSAAWEDGGGFARGKSGLSGWLISNTNPTYNNQHASITVSMSGVGAHPDFGAAVRGTFVGAALTDGYQTRYSNNGAAQTWHLERVVGSAAADLAVDVVVTADATKQITNAGRAFELRAEGENPVRITVVFNGYTLFDVYDFAATRITATEHIGFFGGAS